jgi:hypothetical protein
MRLKRSLKPMLDSKCLRIPKGFLELAGIDGEVHIRVGDRRIEIVEAEDPEIAKNEAMIRRAMIGGRSRR